MISTGLCRWILFLISFSTWTTIANSKEMRVVCYYTNWSVYRPGAAKFTPQNINPYLCTHLIYAFGGFTKDNTLKPFDKYQDIEKGGYAKFTGLKTYNKNLKTMLAIGGWNEGSSRFSPMVANIDRRKELVRNAIKFLRQNHFDGLDLDWEYPSFRDGGKPRDRDNYAQFVQELREEFEKESQKTGRPRLLLTMAVPAGIEYINKGYDVPKLTKYLDWMNILSYDYHSAFEPAVNHHAPLYSLEEDNEYNYDGELNIDYTIKHYLKMGAEASKLVLGIPTYGRSYTLFNPEAFEIGSPADGPGTMGEATRENGYLAYYEICENIKSQDWEMDNPNPKAMGPYAFKDNQWVGYDDENIARVKAEYVAENGLGGIMFWAIDNDDFRGTCHGKPYPLIEAAKEALLNAYGITDNNLISPTSKPLKSRTRSRTKASNKINKSEDDNEAKIESTAINRRRNRFKSKAKEHDVKETSESTRRSIRRKQPSKSDESTTHSSLKIVTPSYTTPPPPATPDMGGSFKCEDEGFFPNPKDCKKYFWCLSGAGDTGIVAHQFTCPAGLYFNKAADSCDYSQNVLCNKKLQKATTSTTTTTTESSTTSTDRPATTTRSIFRTKTTTQAYEDEEYEYDDEDESGTSGKNETEEDPQVIKELIDLIKKAGGIEELEKQLNPSSAGDTTTQSAISKALYEKVLSKSGRTSLTSRKNTYSRNSGGSQSEGLDDSATNEESHSKNGRGKLQYTSISRNRPSRTESADDITDKSSTKVEQNDNDSRKFSKNNQLEYVNIRRSITSSTTEASDTDSRNRILGEASEEDDDKIDDEENESGGESNKRTSLPQYVNIRRQRPTTTENPTTSNYLEIHRGTTEANDESEVSTSKYKTIRRGTISPPTIDNDSEDTSIQSKRGTTTTTTTEASSTRRYINFRRGTTEKAIVNESPLKSQTVGVVSETGEITAVSANPDDRIGSTPLDGPTLPYTGTNNETVNSLLTTESQSTTVGTTNSADKNTIVNISDATTSSENISTTIAEANETSTEATIQKKRPQLSDPRPFSVRGTTTKPITQTAKVSESNNKFRSRIDEEIGVQQNVPTNIQFRSRSSSRFNFNRNSNADSRETGLEENAAPKSRRRLITTTEKVFDDNRTFRPSEIADLSSLTAVDFANVKDINLNQNTRRRRIRPTVSSTTENADYTLETSSRSSRIKLLNASKFGKGRRVVSNEQPKINIQTTTTTKIRGYRATREPISTESIANVDPISSTESINFSPRNRRIIKRFRTTTKPTTSSAEVLFGGKSAELFSDLQQNKVDEENDDNFDDTSIEEGENIKLSESNIRENSDVNSFGTNLRQNKKIIDIHNKASVFGKDFERGEITSKDIRFDIASTEPTFTSRTRKIIRKILPTQTTTTELPKLEQGVGRKRKIIRRLRPTTTLNKVSDENGANFDKQKLQSSTSSEDTRQLGTKLFSIKTSENDFLTSSESSTISTPQNTHSQTNTKFTPSGTEPIDSSEAMIQQTEFTPTSTSTPMKNTESADDSAENTDTTLNFEISTEVTETNDLKKYIFRPTTTTTEHITENKSEIQDEDVVPKRIFRPNLADQRNRFIRYKTVGNNVSNHSNSSFRRFNRINGFSNNNTKENIEITAGRRRFRPRLEQQTDSSNRNNNINQERVERRKNLNREGLFSRTNKITNLPSTVSVTNTESTPAYNIYAEIPNESIENITDNIDIDVNITDNQDFSETIVTTEGYDNKVYLDADDDETNDTTLQNTEANEIEETSDPITETKVTYAISESPSSTEKIQPVSSTSPNSRNNFRYPKNRPSFLRSKYSGTSFRDNAEISSSTPKYRKFSRVTTSEMLSTKKTIFTYKIDAENDENNDEDVDEQNDEKYSTSYFEMTTALPEQLTTDYTPEQEDSTSVTTEIDTVTTNILDTTTPETLTTTDSLLPDSINEISTGDDNISTGSFDSTTINIEFKTNTMNETSTPLPQTTTTVAENTTQLTERSTTYQRKSTLKSINARPKFSPKRLKELNGARSTESIIPKFKPKRFRNRVQDSSTESGLVSRLNRFGTTERSQSRIKFSPTKRTFTTPLQLNKFLYKYSTTENYEEESINNEEHNENTHEGDLDDDDDEYIDNVENDKLPQSDIVSSVLRQSKSTTAKSINRPYFSKKNTTKVVNKPTDDALSDIDTEAVKNRNKNLFSKTRKNNNILNVAVSTEDDTPSSTIDNEYQTITDATLITEDTTKPTSSIQETTEYLTTLHHVFAEVDGTTTEMNKNETTTNKIERLIEVNRIVKFETKEAIIKNNAVELQTSGEVVPVVNKIGEVSRVTVIKIVDKDGNIVEKRNDTKNEIKDVNIDSPVYIPEVKVEISTTNKPKDEEKIPFVEMAKVEEIPAKSVLDKVNLTNIIVAVNKIDKAIASDTNRDDRKIDLFSGINFSKDIAKDQTVEKLDIIDGRSHINVFTPRPLYNTEASTIALEALFKTTERPTVQLNKKIITSNDELLETDDSKFVNVRVLHPDQNMRLEKNYRDDSKVIPIKLLKQDDAEVTLKAEVVEVTPRSFADMIKIIPIRVEMSRQLVSKVPTFRVGKQHVPPT